MFAVEEAGHRGALLPVQCLDQVLFSSVNFPSLLSGVFACCDSDTCSSQMCVPPKALKVLLLSQNRTKDAFWLVSVRHDSPPQMGPDATPHVNDVGWVGSFTVAVAKGKSAVMNNVCKSEEGMEGGEGVSKGRTEMGGGMRSCLLCSSMLLCFFFLNWNISYGLSGSGVIFSLLTAYVSFHVNSWFIPRRSKKSAEKPKTCVTG